MTGLTCDLADLRAVGGCRHVTSCILVDQVRALLVELGCFAAGAGWLWPGGVGGGAIPRFSPVEAPNFAPPRERPSSETEGRAEARQSSVSTRRYFLGVSTGLSA
jgi:hypothetical protein